MADAPAILEGSQELLHEDPISTAEHPMIIQQIGESNEHLINYHMHSFTLDDVYFSQEYMTEPSDSSINYSEYFPHAAAQPVGPEYAVEHDDDMIDERPIIGITAEMMFNDINGYLHVYQFVMEVINNTYHRKPTAQGSQRRTYPSKHVFPFVAIGRPNYVCAARKARPSLKTQHKWASMTQEEEHTFLKFPLTQMEDKIAEFMLAHTKWKGWLKDDLNKMVDDAVNVLIRIA
ncbi:hypothetical protein MCOR25_002501 [Pyricularia grisea]|uniref:Uncharacterized protein n=1 Tax=Pyricularia grisea TaxID=148305 RepID=A0A6P8B2B6_PYRGI|nr:uncharacterized protein PgNI_06815 [Pyricularia grisea]KAI6377520.1 hypothetical protein MCOR25_002501 [Pyricularia grisea]TLD09007.1 hypothetical protein PgNI_06815 [Pyricularia grisea]